VGNPRADIADLRLQGSPNLKRALARGPLMSPARRSQLVALLSDISARRTECLEDVKNRGRVLSVVKYSSKGTGYTTEVVNPNLKIAQQCERQMAALVAQLDRSGPEPDNRPKPGTAEAMYPELFAEPQCPKN